MKIIIVVSAILAVAIASEIDWSQVKPVHQLPSFQARFPTFNFIENNNNNNGRIVGGQVVTPHSYPHQVGLLVDFEKGTGLCGGSLINNNYVLTAAHCVDAASGANVILGGHNISDSSETDRVEIKVSSSSFIIHPNWDAKLIRNDIALIKLPHLDVSNQYKTIRLPSRSQEGQSFDGTPATITGWGVFSDAEKKISPELRSVNVPVISNTKCRLRFPGVIQDSNVCTAGDNGKSACSGDSGGPLIFVDKIDNEPTQIGIVSFGLALGCERGWPSAFTRVTSYLSWIEQNTK